MFINPSAQNQGDNPTLIGWVKEQIHIDILTNRISELKSSRVLQVGMGSKPCDTHQSAS